MANRSELSTIFNNPSFLNDDSQPPPYSSICPFTIGQSMSNFDLKLNEPNSQDHLSPISNVASTSLFQNTSEPISYEQLFLTNLTSYSNMPSSRYLFQSTDPSQPSSMETTLRKQFQIKFPKAYLLRHSLFITVSSLILISFQIILMNNESILSHLGTGLWSGLGNLFTIFLSFITLKHAKLWLLISTILVHFICITISLGALIVINCIAVTRYTSCSYNEYHDTAFGHIVADRNDCSESNMRYANIAMIVLGATCMISFITYFFKLLSVFNNSQSNTE